MGRYIWVIGFSLMVMVQLSVPLKMVLDSREVVERGSLLKFKTAPVDPKDPFRGNYVRLRYEVEDYQAAVDNNFEKGEDVYALIGEGEEGYAEISGLQRQKPEEGDYLEVEVRSVDKVSGRVRLSLPFDKFFMHEDKAPVAERIYFESQRDSTTSTYALISIYRGDGILQDVLIDGVSLRVLAAGGE